jgi:hypothetical protein
MRRQPPPPCSSPRSRFSATTALRKQRLRLGILDQTIWGYSRFEVIPNTVKGIPNLPGDHFHPALMHWRR